MEGERKGEGIRDELEGRGVGKSKRSRGGGEGKDLISFLYTPTYSPTHFDYSSSVLMCSVRF